MKKIITLIIFVLIICGCNANKPKDNGFKFVYEEVDMSIYKSVPKDSCFKKIKITEIDRCIKEKGSGIFYLGYEDCIYCQSMVWLMNEVGQDLGVTIYYIDAFDEDEPYFDYKDMYIEDLYTTLKEEDGEKIVMTPHVFTIINGVVKESQISANYWDLEDPTSDQIDSLRSRYKEMFKPFVS